MFKNLANICNLLFSQLNLTESFEKLISRIPQRREKVEHCIIVFLNYIYNHCDLI